MVGQVRAGQDIVKLYTRIAELEAALRRLVEAIDDMHSRGETFTARVSIATAAAERALLPKS